MREACELSRCALVEDENRRWNMVVQDAARMPPPPQGPEQEAKDPPEEEYEEPARFPPELFGQSRAFTTVPQLPEPQQEPQPQPQPQQEELPQGPPTHLWMPLDYVVLSDEE